MANKSLSINLSSLPSEIESMNVRTNKRTNERIIQAKTIDGQSYIGYNSSNGLTDMRRISVPSYSDRAERNEYIYYLYDIKKYTQDEIAAILDISQSTVSNVLRNR